jgi:hypothetical protein
MSALDFLRQVPVLENFEEAPDSEKHVLVPGEWFLFFSDIQDSTLAIQQGRYRDVNLVGVASISAVLNATAETSVPYIFGGDGAIFVVSPECEPRVGRALRATQKMAQDRFGLKLRIGCIPLHHLYRERATVRVAQLRLSSQLSTWILSGTGLSLGENWVKRPTNGQDYQISRVQDATEGNFSGVECRWSPVPSQRGEILTLMVSSLRATESETLNAYHRILKEIGTIYGNSASLPPLTEDRMRLLRKVGTYSGEARVRTFGHGRWARWLYQLKIFLITRLANVLWKSFFRRSGDHYLREVIQNSDFRKFDGVLRMVLDGQPQQHDRLIRFLEAQSRDGQIAFGVHRSSSALVTCLIFDRAAGKHLHFVDGNDGGYAEAARAWKAQISQLQKTLKVAA